MSLFDKKRNFFTQMENECTEWPDDPDNCQTLSTVVRIFGSLAIAVSLLMISFMLVMKRYVTFVERLVVVLAVYITLGSASCYIQSVTPGTLCHIQGFFIQFFDWTIVGVVLLIAVTLLSSINGSQKIRKWFWTSQIVIIFVSGCLASIPLFGDNYGPAGVWCWVKEEAVYVRFGIWYIPFFAVMSIIIAIYIYMIHKVYRSTSAVPGKSLTEELSDKRYRAEVRLLLLYPIINVLFYTPIAVYRVEEVIHPHQTSDFNFGLVCVLLAQSSGFANALAYFFILVRSHEVSWHEVKHNVLRVFSRTPKARVFRFQVDEGVFTVPYNHMSETERHSG